MYFVLVTICSSSSYPFSNPIFLTLILAPFLIPLTPPSSSPPPGAWWSIVATALAGIWSISRAIRLTTVFVSAVVAVVTALVGAWEDFIGWGMFKVS